jgi:hypothetical protein
VADNPILMGGGAGIGFPDALCTLTAIGHDAAGDLVGFASAHCGGSGSQVLAEGAEDRGPIGEVVRVDDGLDYAVIRFDPAKVTPIPDFDGFAINGIGEDPGFGTRACELSRATGHRCLSVGLPGIDPATEVVRRQWQPGDEGAPVTVDDLLIGMIRAGWSPVPMLAHPRPEIVLISAILADLNAKGGPGAGFTPVG